MAARLPITTEGMLAALRAAGEPTRLRILTLLSEGERTVKDLTDILGQSQPRISRHLKLLADAGLIERHPEGSWVFYRAADKGPAAEICADIISRLDERDTVLVRDRARLDALRREHATSAREYFSRHAANWDEIRSLHANDDAIEAAILEAAGPGPFDLMVDLGTGTGRMLEILSDRFLRGIGIDVSHDMLNYARSRIEREGIANVQVRFGDIYNLALDDGSADCVIVHQVLHFLDDPVRAIEEAGRILKPGGRLIVVDFAPHQLEFLRDQHAHRRLGFSGEQMDQWFAEAGIAPERAISFDAADEAANDRLTVSLWLGSARADGRRNNTASEEIA